MNLGQGRGGLRAWVHPFLCMNMSLEDTRDMPSFEPEVERLARGRMQQNAGADWTDPHTHIRDILASAAQNILGLNPLIVACIPPEEIVARCQALRMLKDAVPEAFSK